MSTTFHVSMDAPKIVSSPKNAMHPGHAGMKWLSAALERLPLSAEGGGVGPLVFATCRGEEEWLVTTCGLVGRARKGDWRWFVADVPNATLGPTARGATLTEKSVIVSGAGGLYELPVDAMA